MRLINTKTIELESTTDGVSADFQYAILSHRWEGCEVTYQDMLSGSAKGMKGYAKIIQTCHTAQQWGLDYAWIDSCCINKESSAELTESINSMWRWYCEARVCFAYLSDVDGPCAELHDEEISSPSDPFVKPDGTNQSPDHVAVSEQFTRSLWFTRGWTLQELIAPQHVLFYNNKWQQFGSKQTLIMTLRTITGIDPLVLQDRNTLQSLTTAKKLSWASKRITKYSEDRAYSMLGIFNVQMPLLYGEGTNAFVRLQEEIIKTSTDLSIFAWEPAAGSMAEATHDILFATTPEQFRNCGSIVPYHEDLVDSSFRLNNRGIVLEDLYVSVGKSGRFGLLNCRYEYDLRGPLALRLCREDELTQQFDDYSTLLSGEDVWIGMGLQDRDPSNVSRLAPWSVNDRVIVYPREGFAQAVISDQRVTILRRHPAILATTAHFQSALIRHPKVWLKHDENDDQSQAFDIIDAFPSILWRLETGTMNPIAYKGMQRDLKACARLRLRARKKVILVAFQITLSESEKFVRGLPEGSEFRLTVSNASIQVAMEILASSKPTMTATCSLDGRQYTALARLEQHLGEVAFVISILEQGPARERGTSARGIATHQNMGPLITFRRGPPARDPGE